MALAFGRRGSAMPCSSPGLMDPATAVPCSWRAGRMAGRCA